MAVKHIIQNHDNLNVRNTGKKMPNIENIKYKRLKLGGDQA
jgi:hypothetical protein